MLVTSDVSRLRQQHSEGVWNEKMVTVSYCLASASVSRVGQVQIGGNEKMVAVIFFYTLDTYMCVCNVELFLILVCILLLDSWSDWICDKGLHD